jgi:DNA-binding MarR family transcriptional regulator
MYIGIQNPEPPIEVVEDQAQELMRRLQLLNGDNADDEISIGQYQMLAVIQSRGPISVGDLVAVTASAQSTTSEVAARLSKAGLISKNRSPDDGRIVLLGLTERGRQVLRRRKKGIRAVYQNLLSSFSDLEKELFIKSIWTLNDILESVESK